jgi:flagellar transcriptional activator FlhD
MGDIVSINRSFLIMAREAASTRSGEVITGLPRPVLDRLGKMNLDEIERLARGAGVSLISFRLNEAELDKLASLHDRQQPAYALSVVATKGR